MLKGIREPLSSWLARMRLAAILIAFFAPSLAFSAVHVNSARVWPAAEYTRLAIESSAPVRHRYFTVKNPDRLVLELENTELNAALEELPAKVANTDPYIKLVRVGYFRPRVVRVVLELKTEVKPSLFTLKPYGEYGHRLVLDIYPAQPLDPLMALVETANARIAAAGGGPSQAAEAQQIPASSAAGDKAAKPAEGRQPGMDVARLVTIAIDAGHGGEDPGARGKRGTHEKDVTLAIARKLKERVDNEPNMRGALIRDADYFIPLQMRVSKARKINADLFVSIHADAFIKSHARGSSVFALSERGATSAAARWLATKENESDLVGGVNLNVKDPYLAQTLLDLSQTATINDSLKLGRAVLSELGGINDLHKGMVEQAGFAVLKAPDIPSILVETAFISNPEEEKKLVDEAYQEKMADAILAGIRRYFEKNPPLAKSGLARNP